MAFLSWLWTGDRIWKDDVIGRADLLYPHQATLKGSERLSLRVKQIALPQKEVLVRLAGYDWVPETKLKRSLRESWQRGRAWRSQKNEEEKKKSAGWLRATPSRFAFSVDSVTAVFVTDQQGQRRFQGLCWVTAYMRNFPERSATGVATAISEDSNEFHEEGNCGTWSELGSGVLTSANLLQYETKIVLLLWAKRTVFGCRAGGLLLKCLLQRFWVEWLAERALHSHTRRLPEYFLTIAF